jgi:hypothetical protein
LVTAQLGNLFSRRNIPQTYRVIAASGGEARAVRRETNAEYFAVMTEYSDFQLSLRIPESQSAVAPARGDEPAICTIAQRENVVSVPRKFANWITSSNIPESHRPISLGRRNVFAIRTEDYIVRTGSASSEDHDRLSRGSLPYACRRRSVSRPEQRTRTVE